MDTYDTFGRLIQVDKPDGGQTITTFNDHSFPREVVTTVKENSTGQTIAKRNYFDGLGRPIQTSTWGEGGKLIVSTTAYDNMGRVDRSDGPFFPTATGEAPANHSWVETTYDNRSRPLTITSPDSNGGLPTTTFSYNGLSTTVTDPDGKMKTEEKNTLGRLSRVIEYNGATQYPTSYTYNAAGDLRFVTDSLGNVTTMNYDTLGRKANMTDPDMGTWGYTYDQNGNLKTQTDAKGQTITFTYDELNRPTAKSYSTGDPTVVYLYDNFDINNGYGRLYSVTNGLVTTTIMDYDTMGRVKSQAKTISGNPSTFTTWTNYDLSGKVTKQTYPDYYAVTYAYYPGSGLLQSVTGSDGKLYATYTAYEPTGQIGVIDHGNGTETSYSYDPSSTRLTGLVTDGPTGLALQDKAYQYSKAGDISTITDQMQAITYSYAYDTLHRLRTETKTGQPTSLTYNYDAIGNITSKVAGTTLTYTPSTTHKHAVGKVTVGTTPYNFTYDANGNLTDGFDLTNLAATANRHIDYNADNMPVKITRAGVATSITYDGNGARAKKVGLSGTTYYVGPHYEIENGVATKYIMAGGGKIAKVRSAVTSYFHKDHLGSSTLETNDAGTVVESTAYLPFGEMRSHSGSTISNYKFTGQELDPETGLYNYNARLYDPVLGKFTSADTIVPNFADPQSLNRYSYCRNNPLAYTDPSGHNFFKDIGHAFERIGREIGRAFHNYGPAIAAIAVAAVVGPWAGAYISGLAMPAGYGCGMVSASTVAGWHMATTIGGGMIAGAAAGATSGGLSAASNGGNVGDAMLKGAGYGAASAAAFEVLNLGWNYAKHITDASSPTNLYDSTGSKMTAGTRPCVGCSSENQNWFTQFGMAEEGLDHNFMIFRYNTDSSFGHFINQVSKVHDFMNSWGYDANGSYVSGTLSYNVAFQAYSMTGMIPAGAYTALTASGPYTQHIWYAPKLNDND